MGDAPTTNSGLPGVGEVAYGSHICHFYRNRKELVDVLVPFFKAGLEQGERCAWITAPPLPSVEAVAELRKAVPDLDRHLAEGRIRIADFNVWYPAQLGDQANQVIGQWLAAEEQALAAGFRGLRASGNTAFVRPEDREGFMRYEARVTDAFQGRRIVGLCSYDLLQCAATDVFEAVHTHPSTLDPRDGRWEILERISGRTGRP
ncbi:MAG TPA: MEDS domain-containing protein [Planctomycetota bacterium]|nr:MEDS domain-containing protein [Planctomycetota bacterium]